MFILHGGSQFVEKPQHDTGAAYKYEEAGPGLKLIDVRNHVNLRHVPNVQHKVKRQVWHPDDDECEPAERGNLEPRHCPSFRQQQKNKHERRTAEDIENLAGNFQFLIAFTVGSKLYQMNQDEADADELEDDAHCKKFRDRMALFASAVDLNRHEEDVDGEEDETLLEDVLLIVGEVINEWTVVRWLLLQRVSVDELQMIVEATLWSIVVLPLTGRNVTITGH